MSRFFHVQKALWNSSLKNASSRKDLLLKGVFMVAEKAHSDSCDFKHEIMIFNTCILYYTISDNKVNI